MSDIERKTLPTGDFARADRASSIAQSSAPPTAELRAVPNPLYRYSSYMYNFTLAAVRKTAANTPAEYMEKPLDLVILKTGGKGTTGLSEKVEGVTKTVSTIAEDGDRRGSTVKEDFSGANKVKGFNQRSPGRFDMFIDNVELDTIMGPNEASGATLANMIKFDVIEPYSINGFIEALHFSAVAAGYLNYNQASYVLKLEFKGYPAGVDIPSPEVVPDSTRYFLLKFASLDVEVTERGTRYRCRAVPWNETVFGITNTIKTPISMSGNTVKEILNDLCKNLNLQIESRDKSVKSENNIANNSDKYFIKFPSRKSDGTLDYNKDNEIANVILSKLENNTKLYKFTDPGDKNKSVKNAYQIVKETSQGKENIESSRMQVQYREKAKIHEIIESVIRDSEYFRTKLKNIEKSIDNYGYFDFFIIKTEVENQTETDTVSRKPFQNFTYVVLPYKVHFTRIPPYSGQIFNANRLKNIILKEYNYIYTGKNNDIINFKITFNSLFFEAIPAAMANTDQPDARFSDSKNDKNDLQIIGDEETNIKSIIVGTPMLRASDIPTSIQQRGGNAGQPSIDPYQAVARNMYNAIINSKVDMVNGEIEIIGDPFYLIQGGIGNFNPKISKKSDRMNKAGDANHLLGEVLIQIRFRNPVGIQSLDAGGIAAFESDDAPFAGIYRINKVKNIFSDGTFKQQLSIVRIAGQTTDNLKETEPNKKITTRLVDSGSVAPGDTSLAVFDQQDAQEGAAITEAQRTAAIAAVLDAQDAEIGAAMTAAEAAQAAATAAAQTAALYEGAEVAMAASSAAQDAAFKQTQAVVSSVTAQLENSRKQLDQLTRLRETWKNFDPQRESTEPETLVGSTAGFLIGPSNVRYWYDQTLANIARETKHLEKLQKELDIYSKPLDVTPQPYVAPSPPVLPENVMKSIDPLPLYGDEALAAFDRSPRRPGETLNAYETRLRETQFQDQIRRIQRQAAEASIRTRIIE
jgi:hypothetical protein